MCAKTALTASQLDPGEDFPAVQITKGAGHGGFLTKVEDVTTIGRAADAVKFSRKSLYYTVRVFEFARLTET
jgi:hypothetical protein